MRRSNVAIAVAAVIGFSLAFAGVQNNIAYALSPYRPVLDQLTRAQTAQTPDEVIRHVTNAKTQLPVSGSILWWSPAKGDFKSIHTELDEIIGRANSVSLLEPGNELFNSEMAEIHSRLGKIQETLAS